MAFEKLFGRLNKAKDIVTEPSEYDELDTSGYPPSQQLQGEGMNKSIRAFNALIPEPEAVKFKNPITGTETDMPEIDPFSLGSLKMLGETAQLAKLKNAIPSDKIRGIAEEYTKAKGMHSAELPPVKVDETNAKYLAKAFDDMKHDPTNPEVKKAYDALIKETRDQYKTIEKTGFKPIKITPDMQNPYGGGSKDLIKDISERNQMHYYPSEQGFGSGEKISDNPMLHKSGVMINGEEVPNNDLFRIVHDYFGHAKEGHGFGPMGEENAFMQHSNMFSPEARRALTTETRGQNSWVNYGPKGEFNRANPNQTVYADQKVGLLPEWATNIPKVESNNDELVKRLLQMDNASKEVPQQLQRSPGSEDDKKFPLLKKRLQIES